MVHSVINNASCIITAGIESRMLLQLLNSVTTFPSTLCNISMTLKYPRNSDNVRQMTASINEQVKAVSWREWLRRRLLPTAQQPGRLKKNMPLSLHKHNENTDAATINYTILTTFLKYINHDIHDHHPRYSDHIHLSAVKTSLGAKSIKFKASQMWNNLPTQLRKIANHHTFKKSLKHYLINKL